MPRGQGAHGARSKRRTSSLRVVSAKRAKINADWASLAKENDSLEQEHMISEIVHMLQQTPEQIKGCWQAVKGNTFAKVADEESHFPDTYVYLTKVPKYFLREWFIALVPDLKANIASIDKVDKFAYLKIMYRIFLVESNTKFPSHVKNDFKEIMEARYAKAGKQLTKLAVSEDRRIAWETCGVYQLLPACPHDKTTKEAKGWEHNVDQLQWRH